MQPVASSRSLYNRPARRAWLASAVVLAAAGLAGCAGLGVPGSVTLSESDLASMLAKQFPKQQRVAEVLDVQMDSLKLKLVPERNRLASDVALAATDRFFGKQVRGQMQFESALRYEPADGTVRLDQVQVQSLKWDGSLVKGGLLGDLVGSLGQGVWQRVGLTLAEKALEGLPIYTLSAERKETLRKAGVQPVAKVTGRGVEITMEPAPAASGNATR